ncbi:hypothetical protein H5410_025723 [Solanum commersonii]|uniref:Uncharacterized protein n=1 Tax=Solanum commersonii TaxID=4109 RepID=A0A9J5YWU3_SOLCO|nr:hypothetical protein H5410_025723 [Solanum commersonii]
MKLLGTRWKWPHCGQDLESEARIVQTCEEARYKCADLMCRLEGVRDGKYSPPSIVIIYSLDVKSSLVVCIIFSFEYTTNRTKKMKE